MSDSDKEIMNILKAKPNKNKNRNLPFKMPKSKHHWVDFDTRVEEVVD